MNPEAAEDAVLLGIDCGTTVLKAAAFDAREGRILASAARRILSRLWA